MRKNPSSLLLLLAAALGIAACGRRQAPEGFQVEPGFGIALVAAEPLVQDPVDLEFNERGEAMVLEMPGYPLEDSPSRLRILSDSDGDGIYDRSSLFAGNLRMASSFLPFREGVLVAAPPYLLWLRDQDRDGAADQTDTLMGGFATGNLQHNYNGLTYGLDNWIYAANGGNDGAPYWWGDSSSAMALRGQDFRFHIGTRRMERLGESSGGFGLGMDEYGRIFETHNLEHIVALVFPARYRERSRQAAGPLLANISDHEENGLSRIYPAGEQVSRMNHPEQSGYFSGSCGITYYGGGAFGKAYDSTVWVADVVLNLIHVDKVRPRGSSFEARRLLLGRDFLASTDRAFRPVNLSVGPDGALYVVDMRRDVIEHPEWIPDDIEKTLDLHAGKGAGRIYRITGPGASHRFNPERFQSVEGLLASLSHANLWVRMSAQRLLVERELDAEALEGLRGALSSGSPWARLHALHILAARGLLTEAAILAALDEAAAPARERALVLAEDMMSTSPDILTKCIRLLGDPDQRVRMQAALSLSTLDDSGSLFSSHREALLQGLAAAALLPADRWNALAISLAAQGAAADLFAILASSGHLSGDLPSVLAPCAAESEAGFVRVLEHLPCLGIAEQQEVLRSLGALPRPLRGSSLEAAIKTLERSGDWALIPELAALRQRLGLPLSQRFFSLSRAALRQAGDEHLPDSLRLRQLALLSLLPYPEKRDLLFDCLRSRQPVSIQEAALRQLAQHNEGDIGERLASMWQELGPHIRKYAGDLLLDREQYHDALLSGLEQGRIGIGEMNFDLERRRTLLWWTENEDTKRRAAKLFSDTGVSNRQEAIEKMKPSLALQGNAGAGARIFDTHCGSCHQYAARGREVGPALTEIARKSKATLLHDILDPNAAADPRYISHRVETHEGRTHMGIIAAETDHSLTLLKMGGERITLPKTAIKSFRSLGSSLMMEGFEHALSEQDMADLLAFLQQGA